MGRSLLVCGFALLGLGLLAPTAEAAHCGWYALGEPQALRDLARLIEGDDAGPKRPIPAPRVPACNGPSCSGQPASPTPPVVTQMTPGEDWACPIDPVALGPDGASFLTPDEADSRPIRRGPSIFHPPRPATASA